MRRYILPALVSSILTAACAGEYGVTYSPDVYGPDLVEIQPGVQVIADWNEPIFFVDGLYWRYYGDSWYRSTYYTGGWAYAPPPPVLLHVDRPYHYAHYRPHGWQPSHYEARPGTPVVRDHRSPHPAPPPPHGDHGHDRDHRH